MFMTNFIKFQLGSLLVQQEKSIAEASRCGGVKRWQHSLSFRFGRCWDSFRNQRSLTLRHNKVNEHLKQEFRSQFQGFATQDFASCDWYFFQNRHLSNLSEQYLGVFLQETEKERQLSSGWLIF